MKRIKVMFFVDRPHITYEMLKVLHDHDVPIISMEVYANVIYFKLPYLSDELFENIKREFSLVYGFEKLEEIDYSAVEERDLELRAVLDFIPQGVLLLDAQGKIKYSNHYASTQVFKLSDKEISGQNIIDTIKEDGLEEMLTTSGRGIVKEIPVSVGGDKYSLSAQPIFTDEQIFCGSMVYLHRLHTLNWFENNVTFEDIKGTSSGISLTMEKSKQFAKLDTPILITGEVGTGKGLLARAIHNYGNRSNKPFVSAILNSVPAELLGRELFGQGNPSELGFRQGLFQWAEGGTLFIDDISKLPFNLQSRLLTVMTKGVVIPIGTDNGIPSNVRIICADKRDLDKAVKEGEFLKELNDLIQLFSIRIPPLRERIEDLPELANIFLADMNQQYDKNINSISESAIEKLKTYSWPKNSRQLLGTIQKAVQRCSG
ncbi:MAG: sigma 54-interacting transcriptional regulator [Tissierellia bacterium]|nr:sigma 54-interacting transcriptional regulator [Tissierellia bacterium]